MFAKNKTISKRQLRRQFIIGSVCLAFLFVNPKICNIDSWSIWGILIGFLVILLTGRGLCSTKPNYKGIQEKGAGWLQIVVYAICIAYSVILGSLILSRVSTIAGTFFLEDTQKWIIQILILFVVFLGMRGELQQHARMMEVFYGLFIFAGVIVLIGIVLQIPIERFVQVKTWIPNLLQFDGHSLLKGFVGTIVVGLGVLFIPFFTGNVNTHGTTKRTITLLIEFGFIFFIVLYLLYHIKFGIVGYQAKAFPMVSLVYNSNLWWVSLVVFGFILTLSNVLFLGDYILRLKGIMWGKYPIIIVVFLMQFALK